MRLLLLSICIFCCWLTIASSSVSAEEPVTQPMITNVEIGEYVFAPEKPMTIRWTGINLPTYVRVEFSTDDGKTWTKVATVPSQPTYGSTTIETDTRSITGKKISAQWNWSSQDETNTAIDSLDSICFGVGWGEGDVAGRSRSLPLHMPDPPIYAILMWIVLTYAIYMILLMLQSQEEGLCTLFSVVLWTTIFMISDLPVIWFNVGMVILYILPILQAFLEWIRKWSAAVIIGLHVYAIPLILLVILGRGWIVAAWTWGISTFYPSGIFVAAAFLLAVAFYKPKHEQVTVQRIELYLSGDPSVRRRLENSGCLPAVITVVAGAILIVFGLNSASWLGIENPSLGASGWAVVACAIIVVPVVFSVGSVSLDEKIIGRVQRHFELGDIAGALQLLQKLRPVEQTGTDQDIVQFSTSDLKVEQLALESTLLRLLGRDIEAQRIDDFLITVTKRQVHVAKNVQGHIALGNESNRVSRTKNMVALFLAEAGLAEMALKRIGERGQGYMNWVNHDAARGEALAQLGRWADVKRCVSQTPQLSRFSAWWFAPDPLALDLIVILQAESHAYTGESMGDHLGAAKARLGTRYIPGHPYLARLGLVEAHLAAEKGDWTAAISTMQQTLSDEDTYLEQIGTSLPEVSLLRIAKGMESHLERYLGYALRGNLGQQTIRDAFEAIVRRKGLVFQQAAALSKRTDEPSELKAIRQQLSLHALGTNLSDPKQRAEFERLVVQRHKLEAKLARKDEQPENVFHNAITLPAIQQQLASGETLLDFARAAMDIAHDGEHCIVVFIVHGHHAEIALVNLCYESELDDVVREYRNQLDNDSARGLGAVYGDSAKPPTLKPFRIAYLRILQPIADRLNESKDLVITPTGSLNRVSFASLLGPDEEYLVEKFGLRYLTSTRSLLGASQTNTPSTMPTFIGSPAFDDHPTEPSTETGTTRNLIPARMQIFSGMTFSPLPGAEHEIERIQQLYAASGESCTIHTGQAARSNTILDLINPRLLHIATHGFFLQDVPLAGPNGLDRPTRSKPRQDVSLQLLSPYLRCGLALAGANAGAERRKQGILTAEQILSLRLRGTELVVLSACETARGVEVGQSDVQGLVRAFLLAGTKSVVASLWKVPDAETVTLMEAFYQNHIQGIPPHKALVYAMRALLKTTNMRDQPAHWAAFIAVSPCDRSDPSSEKAC
ncbi:MAG TPA: hypothetical protein DD473_20605 [Planctomycetaceae bacterium]|nr:hypothetical protein [Planctomycetaceae bacterium]